MIADGDTDGEKDGLISLEEFKSVVRLGSSLPTAELWNTVRQERRLGKGAKVTTIMKYSRTDKMMCNLYLSGGYAEVGRYE